MNTQVEQSQEANDRGYIQVVANQLKTVGLPTEADFLERRLREIIDEADAVEQLRRETVDCYLQYFCV